MITLKSTIIKALTGAAGAAAVSGAAAVFAPYLKTKVSHTKGTPFSSKYKLDEKGYFIKNIPYDKYLKENSSDRDEKIFDIRDFGASPENNFKKNREAVNLAIKTASEEGGGVVLVTGGEYFCTNIKMMSNVTLRIERDSALANIDYETKTNENTDFYSLPENRTIQRNAFIYADDAENITIEGPGKIKGNGASYCNPQRESSLFYPLDTFNLKVYVNEHRKRIMMGKRHEMTRDFIMAVNNCKNVAVKNLEIYEAGSWTCRMEGNENLLFENVIINNNVRVANSDGIDIMGGANTVIRNCFIATGDDGISLKTDPGNKEINGVTIENCEIMSLANCFKIGTATCNNIKNISVKNCYFFMPGIAGGYSGIAIEATDGGKVENVSISGIEMEHITSPLLIWLGYRKKGSELEKVNISNITAKECDLPSAVTGYKKGSEVFCVKDVTLKDFYVTYRNAKESNIYYPLKGAYEGKLNMGGYPEITRVSHMYIHSHEVSPYYDLPVYGLFARNVKDLKIGNFVVIPRSSNKKPFTNINKSSLYNIKNLNWI